MNKYSLLSVNFKHQNMAWLLISLFSSQTHYSFSLLSHTARSFLKYFHFLFAWYIYSLPCRIHYESTALTVILALLSHVNKRRAVKCLTVIVISSWNMTTRFWEITVIKSAQLLLCHLLGIQALNIYMKKLLVTPSP